MKGSFIPRRLVLIVAFLTVLYLMAGVVKTQVASATITGQIRDAETGFPVVGDVILADPEADLGGKTGFDALPTDEFGVYEITGVLSGEKVLIAKAHGYGIERQIVIVGAGQLLTNIDFELEKSSVISGRVVNENDIPISGVTIRALYTAYSKQVWKSVILADELSETQTNDLGEFTLTVTPFKEFVVETSREGYSPGFSKEIIVNPALPWKDIVIRLPKGVSVRGVILDETGNSIAGARVRLRSVFNGSMPSPLSHSIALENRGHQVVFTNADGEFVFRPVAEGPKKITVTHASHYLHERAIDVVKAEAINGMTNIQVVLDRR